MNRAVLVFCAVLALASSAAAQDAPAPRVYPNPISGQRVVTVQTDSPEPARLEIFDVRGRVVPHDQPLAAGTYFVRLRYGNGTISQPTPITLVANGRRQFQLLGPAAQTELPGMSFLTMAGPEITTLPADSLGLGDAEVGASVQDTVFVRNDGDSDLTVSSAVLTLGGVFSILSGGSGGVVIPGDSLEVVIQFAPTSVGAQADTLTVASDDVDEPSVQVEVTGTGTAPAMPEIETSTDSLGFGMAVVGTTVRDTVVVRNLGTATLSVSSASLNGGADIVIESGGGASSIAPGDSVEIALAFTPSVSGVVADTLTIVSDDADEPSIEVELTGEGTPVPEPEIRTSTDSIGFGMVVIGTTVRDTVTVYNDGTAALLVSSSSLGSGTVFVVESGGGSVSIAPGDSALIALAFTPTTVGVVADTLTIASDDLDEPSIEVELTGEGMPVPAPEIDVMPDSLGLGDVLVGASAQDTVTVHNLGTADLTLASLSLATGGAFTIVDGGAGGVVAPGDSVSVVIAFSPSALGAQVDTLTVVSDDDDEPSVQVEVTGTGVQPDVAVAPDSLGFGSVLVGATREDSVVVRNTGTSVLSVSSVTLTSGIAFSIVSGGDPTMIAPGDSAVVVVAFAPVGLGATADTLTVTSDDPDEASIEAELTGTGISPEITVAPDSLGLGAVDIGLSVQDTVVVRNDGTADLDVSSLAMASGIVFTIVSGGDPVVLAPGDSVEVVVAFAPTFEGAQADTLVVTSDDLDEAVTEVEVTGTGVGYPEITVVPDSLGFGDVLLGSSRRDTVVVRNDGTSALALSSIALASGVDFVIESGGDPTTLAVGDSVQVALLFTPPALGTVADTLTVASDDADEPSVEVVLTGTGVLPDIEVVPDSLGFGDVVVGTSRQDSVVVRNTGTSALNVSSVVLASGAAYSIVSGGDPTTIAPGDSAVVVLAFAPVGLGAAADTLTVTSDDPDEASVELELTGTGVSPEITAIPDSLGFGLVRVGATARDTITVRNDGTSSLSLASIALSNGTAFAIEDGGDPMTVAPGDSVRIALAFSPLAVGAVADTLSIASDDLDEPTLIIELTGTGISPEITVAPDSLGLGAVDIGLSVQDTVVVRNDGTADLDVSSLAMASGIVFTIVSGGDPVVLAPGDSVEVVVAFAPTFEGAQADTLVVTSDDLDEAVTEVEVTGTGVGYPEITVVQTSLAFGTVQIGEQPQDTVYVRNDGNGTMSVGTAILGAASPSAYSIVSGGSGGTIAPGDSLAIVVAFGPIYETEQLATLTIPSDDADEPSVVVALSGTGLSPGYVMIYVVGDSQAAGKGDADTSCALRPDAVRRGWFYARSSDTFIPVCSAGMPDEFKSTVMPAMADEVYERYERIPLFIYYTVKGTPLTPEAIPGNPQYWHMGGSGTPAGENFANARILFKRAKAVAQATFASGLQPVAGIHSFGGIDARKWFEDGAGDPNGTFAPRLASFDAVLRASRLTPLYFELGRAPGRPAYTAPLNTFQAVFDATIPADRIVRYDDHVFAEHTASGLGYSRAGWYADVHGHLGSLGLDYLGEQLSIALDL